MKTTKILSLIAFLLSFTATIKAAEQSIPDNEIHYTSSDGNAVGPNITTDGFGAHIISHTYENGVGIITFGGPVTKIGDYTFQYCDYLTSITIPNSVTSIGKYAFYGCESLTSVIIGNSVMSIGNNAFFGCISLLSITIPNSVISIEDWAFSECNSLTSITIPNSVTSIGDYAFRFCGSLTYITIPNSVKNIGDGAFWYCYSLTSITIPNSVISLGALAFGDCTSLTTIAIPDSITYIENKTFYNCTSLTSVAIPSSVTDIGSDVFNNCYNLDTIYCNAMTPPSVFREWSFANYDAVLYVPCEALDAYKADAIWGKFSDIQCIEEKDNNKIFYTTSNGNIATPYHDVFGANITNHTYENGVGVITFDAPVTKIGDDAFNREHLTSITIPNSVTSIGKLAFCNCSFLTSIIIPNNVISIGTSAFADCSSLTSISIGDNVLSIGDGAFANCSSLVSVTIPNTVTSIGNTAFNNCLSLTSISIGNHVSSIGDYAFGYCYSLTSITIPSSVTSIGYRAIDMCQSLSSIVVEHDNKVYDSRNNCNALIHTSTNTLIVGCANTVIPNNVTHIGDFAFFYLPALTSITIPKSITTIGQHAFSHNFNLRTIYCYATTPPALNKENTFYNYDFKATLYVPCEALDAYKTDSIWGKFNNIQCIAEEQYNKIRYTSTDGNIVTPYDTTAFGVNIISNTYEDGQGIITFDGPVTKIGENAFEDSENLMSIILHDSIVTIDDYAFANCSQLTTIKFGKNLRSIGTEAFTGVAIDTLIFPEGIDSISSKAFSSCANLKVVSIPTSLQYAPAGSGDESVFLDCSSIDSIYWNAHKCPNNVFHSSDPYSSSIRSIEFGDSIQHIFSEFCMDFTALTNVILPTSLQSISDAVFYGCDNLDTIYCYATTPPELYDEYVFSNYNATLYIPCEAVDVYKADAIWGMFSNIQCIETEEPPCQDVYTEFEAKFCGLFTWNSVVCTEPGDYIQTYAKADGCDSIVTLHLIEDCPVTDPCEHVAEIDWHNGIRLSQLSTGWYKLYVGDIHANQSAFTIQFINDLACPATMNRVYYANCEDSEALIEGAVTYELGETIQTMSYADFADIVAPHVDYLYLNIKNIVENCPVIDPCEHVTELDWHNGIRLSQLSTGWYKLYVGEIHANQSDISYPFINDMACPVIMSSAYYSHCNDTEEDAMMEMTRRWALGEIQRTISYTDFTDMVPPYVSVDYLYLNITSIVEDCQKDTIIENITDWVCDGGTYEDILGEGHVISSLITDTHTWSNTIETDTTITIYNYTITPIVPPTIMTNELLATIPGATPVLIAGKKVDVTGTLEAIKNYYNMNDTEAFADVESVAWATGADVTLACDAESHTMILNLTAGCDLEILEMNAELVFEVAPIEVMTTTETAVICEGETYQWQGISCSETGSYTFEVKNEEGCVVAIKVLELTVIPAEIVTTADTATICEGETYTWNVNGKIYENLTAGIYNYADTIEGNCSRVIATLTLNVNSSITKDINITACDSYTWNGQTYTQSGEYTYTTVAANGCDSIVTLHLTIYKSEYIEETVTSCDSYEWNGQTYTESGVYTYTTTTDQGCEHVEVLHLTIYKSEYIEKTVTSCDSYEWNGQTYTESGEYTYTITTDQGCEHVEVLHLTIIESVTYPTEVMTICEGETYIWRGMAYSTAGTYEYEEYGPAGCIVAIYTLQLTVNPVEKVIIPTEVTVCETELPYIWNVNGKAIPIPTAGVYTDVVTAECEEITSVLTLIVEDCTPPCENVYTEEYVTICHGETYTWNGQTYSTEGEYSVILSNANGCDSVATLYLTILPEAIIVEESATINEEYLPYTWRGQQCYSTGTYKESVPFANYPYCDSVIYVLNLTVEAPNKCGQTLYWHYSNNTLTITGSGDMYDDPDLLSYRTQEWYPARVNNIILPNALTHIGNVAFADCSNLTQIVIPNSVNSIGDGAFSWTGLQSVTIPASVTELGEQVFEACNNLHTIIYEGYPTVISNQTIHPLIGCVHLDTVIAPAALWHCTNADKALENRYGVPHKARYIEVTDGLLTNQAIKYIAQNATALEVLDLTNTTNTTLPYGAFSHSYLLTQLYLPAYIETLPESMIEGGNRLMEITIPATVTEIGNYAFAGCVNIWRMTVEATTPPKVYENTFDGISRSISVLVPAGSEQAYREAEYWREFFIDNTNSPLPISNCQKILREDQILILREGKVYTTMGQLITIDK